MADPDLNCNTMLCKDCGRRGAMFHVPDDVWLVVTGTREGVLCFDCFNRTAIERGVVPGAWMVVPVGNGWGEVGKPQSPAIDGAK